MESSTIGLKKLLCVSSDNSNSPKEKADRVSYSKDHLMILSKNQPSQTRPDCLSTDCLGDDGKWDPEKWHQSFERSTHSEGARKQFDLNEIKEESNVNVVLGPQRRSFQGGCHVASKEKPSAYPRSALSSTGSKLSERSLKSSHQQEHDHPHLKRFHSLQNGSSDWSRKDSDNKKFDKLESSTFNRKSKHSDYKRYVPPNKKYNEMNNSRDGYHHYEESEPEWISYGPKSQFDTIELSGFDDTTDDFSWMGGEIPMDDVPDRKKKITKPPPPPPDPEDVKSSALKSDVKADHVIDSDVLEVEVNESDDVFEENTIAEKDDKVDEKSPTVEEPVIDKVDDLFGSSEGDTNKESRFSRWFSHDPSFSKDEQTSVEKTSTRDQKTPDDSNLISLKENEQLLIALQQQKHILQQQQQQQQQQRQQLLQQQQQQQQQPTSQTGVTRQESDLSSVQSMPATTMVDFHSKAAFDRLVASIRATDKVKEQMQQRNQKMQALQTRMTSNKVQNNNCYNLSSIEGPMDASKNLQSNLLKQQLEKQKDAYQLKMRQIEQKQKSSPTFSNSDMLQMNKSGMHSSFAMQNSSSHMHDSKMDERAAATASLAAKLAGKNKEEKIPSSGLLDRLYANHGQSSPIMNEQNLLDKESNALLKLQRMNSVPEGNNKSKSFHPAPNNMANNSLAIAQMLKTAGVTEEQLKQLTLEQQELIISMVQNQYSQKDIGKFINLDGRINPKLSDPAARAALGNMSFANSSKDLLLSKSLSGGGVSRSKSAPLSVSNANNSLSFLTNTSTALSARSDASAAQTPASAGFSLQTAGASQSHNAHNRLLPRNLMTVQPTPIPVVPFVSPNLAPRILTPTMAAPPHLTPHPAYLLQLQQQQVLASQLAQQHAMLASLQNQQLAAQASEALKLQQSVQNMRLGQSRPSDSTAGDRSQFNNPLSQWFSSDILRQSQFPPVSQLTGQQTMKLSSAPRDADSIAHNAKQH